MTEYALFETAIGTAGIAWNDAGLVACHLPERDAETARRGFLRHAGPQLGHHGRLFGRGLPVHAPGQRADQHRMHQHGQHHSPAEAG